MTNKERHAHLNFVTIREAITKRRARSAWDKGVNVYALELLESLKEAADGGYFDPDDLHAPKILAKAL